MIDKLFPDVFFISGFALMFLVLIYLPVLLWLLKIIWRKLPVRPIGRAALVLLITFIALAVPLGDAYLGSLKLERLCKTEGGKHIYKTVVADGFYSKYLYEDILDYGYSFAEGRHRGKLYRIFRKDAETIWQQIEEPQSHYIFANERKVLSPLFAKTRFFVANRITDEVLGERVTISYYGGWLDRYIFLSWIDYRPLQCDMKPFVSSDLFLNILIPPRPKQQGETS